MKNLYLIAFLLLGLTAATQAQNNVGIGTNTPDGSAMLDISSTTKGTLFPRMTTVQRNAITTPATGLIIYNTTSNCLEFYNSTSWQTAACKCASKPYAGISGPAKVAYNQQNIVYTANYDPSYTYTWTVNGYASIASTASGVGVNSITVNVQTSGGVLGTGRAFNVGLTVTNECGTSAAIPLTVTAGGYQKWGWSNSITDNLFFVDGINSIQIKAWGAGGGSGDSGGGTGGGGGYATGTLTPTAGSYLYLIVGKGGVYNPGNTVSAEGGGATTTTNATNSGGGYTGVFSTSTPSQASAYIIAGGGGGCGRNNSNGKGGGGGGQDGYAEDATVFAGKGGGASAGGAGGATCTSCAGACAVAGTNGSALQGGNGGANYNCRQSSGWGAGGAGGGGYWGAGGGGAASSSSSKWYPGGGGGSSYVGGVSGGSMTTANYATRANDTDSDLTSGQANGGAGSGAVGGNGVLVFRW